MVEETQNDIVVLLAFVAAIIAIMILISFLVNVWIPFSCEKKYIKTEISRTTGIQKKYWKMQLMYLYFKHIPILGKFIFKKLLK